MAQPILKRRLNPLLLISTVAALSLLAGVAVISQDRIAAAQEDKEKWQQKFNEKKSALQKIRAEAENKSRRIDSVKSNLSSTYAELQRLKSKLENKTDQIQTLRSRLDEQREDLNQSDTIRELNESLSIVCALTSSSSSTVEENCNKWNHEVGTASES